MSKEVTLILPPSNYKFDEAMKTLRTKQSDLLRKQRADGDVYQHAAQ